MFPPHSPVLSQIQFCFFQTPLISPLQKKGVQGTLRAAGQGQHQVVSSSCSFLLTFPVLQHGSPAALQENLQSLWAVFSSGISICPGVVPHGMLCEDLPWQGNICPGLSPPWAAGKICAPWSPSCSTSLLLSHFSLCSFLVLPSGAFFSF